MLRFATSPTGDMHIEELRVAILNFLIAQQKKEPFIVRMEDTDSKENIEGKDTEIMQILEKFSLKHTSVFHQSEHLHMHQTLAIKLLKENKAFVCTCTYEELEKERKKAEFNKIEYHYSGKCASKTQAYYENLKENKIPFVIRLKKPQEAIITHDLIKGNFTTLPNKIDDFIILQKDSTPTHNFASACDDMLSGVTFIIQSTEYLSHTPRQQHIKTQLGYEAEIEYAHLPSIFNSLDNKIHHQEDTNSVKWLFKEGYVPDAIINYLLLLGNNSTPKEIFTLPEAIESFNLESISKFPIQFNINKLKFINREHLKMMDNKQLSTLFGFADESIGKLAKLYLEEVSTIKELRGKIEAIFAPKILKEEWKEEMILLKQSIQNAPMINSFLEFEKYLKKETKLKDECLFTPLRLLLTNTQNGPELSDLYPLIKPYLLEIAS